MSQQMITKSLSIIIILLSSLQIFSQSDLPAEIMSFVPKGYSVVKYVKGNLNLDNKEDVILVLGKNGEDSLSNSETPLKRQTLILLGKDKNYFTLHTQNENAVYYYNYDLNFREALTDISIDGGIFSIAHYGGFAARWARTSTFKYDSKKKNWYLSKDEFSSFKADAPEGSEKETVLTSKQFGKITFSNFNIYKEGK